MKDHMDFSEEKKLELFLSESYGDVYCTPDNGWSYGKQQLNITVAMWKEDLLNLTLHPIELYSDEKLPVWWLDKIFKIKEGSRPPLIDEVIRGRSK